MRILSDLLFGTSGWLYKEWVGPFYEDAKKMFSYYARFFNTVEINSTFYRYPSESTVHGLTRTSPKDFIFSAKMPKLITHQKRLDLSMDVKSDLSRFLELLEPLNARGKLGCILIQLPPSFIYKRDSDNLEAFLEILPEGYEFAIEFRNTSWMRKETWTMLKEHNVAYCIVDEPLLPPKVQVTADFAYFRWHGRGVRPWYDYHYDEKELREWVPKIEKVRGKVKKLYGYFNNHYHGYAIENCIEILEMLNAVRHEYLEVKEKIIRHNIERMPQAYGQRIKLGTVTVEPVVSKLLLKLTDNNRISRGFAIRNEEIIIKDFTTETIKARVREYMIQVDLKRRTLKHDCDDWLKGLGTKRLCKHFVKLFISLTPEMAETILKDLTENKDKWVFKPYQTLT